MLLLLLSLVMGLVRLHVVKLTVTVCREKQGRDSGRDHHQQRAQECTTVSAVLCSAERMVFCDGRRWMDRFRRFQVRTGRRRSRVRAQLPAPCSRHLAQRQRSSIIGDTDGRGVPRYASATAGVALFAALLQGVYLVDQITVTPARPGLAKPQKLQSSSVQSSPVEGTFTRHRRQEL